MWEEPIENTQNIFAPFHDHVLVKRQSEKFFKQNCPVFSVDAKKEGMD